MAHTCFVLALIVVSLLSYGSAATTTEPLKVGIIGPFLNYPGYTNSLSYVGESTAQGALMAAAYHGFKVRFFTNDTDCDPTRAPAAISWLLHKAKVDVVIGADCSGSTVATFPFIAAAKVPYITAVAETSAVRTGGKYIYRTLVAEEPADTVYANKFLYSKGHKLGIVYSTAGLAVNLAQNYQREFTKLGGTVVWANFTAATSDPSTIVAAVNTVAAEQPDVWFLTALQITDIDTVLSAYRSTVPSTTPLFLSRDLWGGALLGGNASALLGAYQLSLGKVAGLVPWEERFAETFGLAYDNATYPLWSRTNSQGYEAAGYDAMTAVITALECKSPEEKADAATIQKYLPNVKFSGAYANVETKFDSAHCVVSPHVFIGLMDADYIASRGSIDAKVVKF